MIMIMIREALPQLHVSVHCLQEMQNDSDSLVWESSTEEDDLGDLSQVKDSGFDGVRMFHNPVSSMPAPRQMQDKFFQNLEIYRGGYVLSSDNALAMHCFLHSLNFEAASLWCKVCDQRPLYDNGGCNFEVSSFGEEIGLLDSCSLSTL